MSDKQELQKAIDELAKAKRQAAEKVTKAVEEVNESRLRREER